MTDSKLSSQSINDVLRRLRRIEGQARGIQKMVSESRPGEEILQQMNAMNAAIHGASLAYLHGSISSLLASADPYDQNIIVKMMKLVEKLP